MESASPLQLLEDPLFDQKKLTVFIKRDDLLHPHIMGNKWRKLKYNLEQVKKQKSPGVITFGGAFSNHIAATAAACNEYRLNCVGIIRGEELKSDSNPTLRFAHSLGMHLEFVTRSEYREVKQMKEIKSYPNYTVLPEGGTNELAIKGCEELISELDVPFDYLTVAVGTGGTMAGLLKGMEGKNRLLGFSSLKGNFIHEEFHRLLKTYNIPYSNYELITDYHFGGYGKVTGKLVDFINETRKSTGMLFDPIYTGKMYFGLLHLIQQDRFTPGSTIVIVHTGGLQGIEGFNEMYDEKIATH